MIIQRIQMPVDRASEEQTVTLGENVWRLRFTWRQRINSWHLDILRLDGTPVILGRRLSANWSIARPIATVIEGAIVVANAEGDPSDPDFSGFAPDTGRVVLYVPQSEVDAAQVATSAGRVLR